MHSELTSKVTLRKKRAHRVRTKLHGTRHKPRLSVFKSNKHIAAQLIDDDAGVTLAHVSSYGTADNGEKAPKAAKSKKTKEEKPKSRQGKKSKATAEVLGRELAELAHKHQVKEIVFDRGCYKYHGILASFADAVRAAGIQF